MNCSTCDEEVYVILGDRAFCETHYEALRRPLYSCYRCGNLLEMESERGRCHVDNFWVDKPWEPRAEMSAETKSFEAGNFGGQECQ